MHHVNPNELARRSQVSQARFGLLAALVLLQAFAPSRTQAAEGEGPTESEVKAAMIFNFAQFVAWPESNPKPAFVIGILGEDPIAVILEDTLKGDSFQNRAIQVRRLASLNDVKTCDILFVSQSQKKHTAEILDAVRGGGTLTIGDTDDFVSLGGMIAFKKEGARVRFQINPDAASKAGLTISSKLLRLAIVQNGEAAKGRN